MDARAITWAGRMVWGLVASTAALAVAGITAMFLELPAPWPDRLEAVCVFALAGVAGFALGVANAAAAAMRELADDWRGAAFWLALAVAVLTGLVSLVGVHLGWVVLTGADQALPSIDTIDAAGLGLAFVKPAMSYVLAACADKAKARVRAEADAEANRRAEETAAERANRHVEALARIEAQSRAANRESELEPAAGSPRTPAPGSRRKSLRVIEKVAAGAAAAAVIVGAGSAADATVGGGLACEPAARVQTVSCVTPEARAHAKRLLAQGLTPKAASERTGVPHGTCKRYAAELRAMAKCSTSGGEIST